MILKSFVVVEKENRYLLIREAAHKWEGKWFLPGGKLKVNETPEKAALREVKEEAGCSISIKGIFYLRYRAKLFNQELSIFYAAIPLDKELKKKPDKHSQDARWFTYEEIRQLPLRQKLLEVLNNYTKSSLIPVRNFKIL